MATDKEKKREVQGIQSVEHAFFILDTIKKSKEPLTLSDISRLTNMSKSRVQKYINSFLKLEALVRSDQDYTYSFGSKLLEFGVHALKSNDIIEMSDYFLKEIRNELNQSSALNIWTQNGPLIVKSEPSGEPISIDIQPGYRPPILKSATGKCFAAYMEASKIKDFIEKDIQQYNLDRTEIEKELEEVRNNGYSFRDTTEEGVSGGVAITCADLRKSGNILDALSIIGFHDGLNTSPDSKEVQKLKEVTSNLSKMLH